MSTAPIIWVEGIIGCGKSTLSRALSTRLRLRLLSEPVSSNPFLEEFYRDPKRWAYPMQVYLLHRRYNLQRLAAHEALGDAGYAGSILDRGLPGDRVFAQMHVRAGNIHPLEWMSYEYAYDVMSASLTPPSLVLFLDVEPEKALERVIRRSRAAEGRMTLQYLRDLRDGYMDLLCQIQSGQHGWSRGMDVVRLPWNVDSQPIDQVEQMLLRRFWPGGLPPPPAPEG